MPPANSKFWRTGPRGPQPPPGPLLAGGDDERRRVPHLFRRVRVVLINGFRTSSTPLRATSLRRASYRPTTERPHNPFEGCGRRYVGCSKNASPVRGEPAAL